MRYDAVVSEGGIWIWNGCTVIQKENRRNFSVWKNTQLIYTDPFAGVCGSRRTQEVRMLTVEEQI